MLIFDLPVMHLLLVLADGEVYIYVYFLETDGKKWL